jgi:hypothetical protein
MRNALSSLEKENEKQETGNGRPKTDPDRFSLSGFLFSVSCFLLLRCVAPAGPG